MLIHAPPVDSIYPVSKCAKMPFPSVTNARYAESGTDGLLWFWPLKIMGEYRLDHNRDSREEYKSPYHFEAEVSARLLPNTYTPDFMEELLQREAKWKREEAGRSKRDDLRQAMNCLLDRQRQVVILRYKDEMKVAEIANRLGIHKSTVSATLKRAMARLERFV